jgi:hypothetical protein
MTVPELGIAVGIVASVAGGIFGLLKLIKVMHPEPTSRVVVLPDEERLLIKELVRTQQRTEEAVARLANLTFEIASSSKDTTRNLDDLRKAVTVLVEIQRRRED